MNKNPENGIEKDNPDLDSEENIQSEIEDSQEKPEDVSTAETAELSENDLTESAVEVDAPSENVETAELSEKDLPTDSVEDEAVTQEAVKIPADEELHAPAAKTAAASSSSGSMGTLPKFLILIGVLIALGAGLVFWKAKVGDSHAAVTSISKEEMELILQDVNPMMLRQLSQNPEAKKELATNVKELFAVASQAEKEGLTADLDTKRELENFETEILATNYDKAINKDKGPMPPFGFITEERIKQFWDGADAQPGFWDKIGFGSNPVESREAEFNKFLESKLKVLGETNPQMKDRELTEEERKQARDYFAKTRIYAAEARAKQGVADNGLPADFFKKVELQTKLQKAQFLARLYSQKTLTKKLEVTDEDVKKYIAEHPELGSKEEKKAKAEEILNRVKAGEDFTKLAKEFSDDPGSKDKGGLYEGITEGAFVPEFEAVAFALEPGQLHPELVESNFGYHIIKLEKKGEDKGPDGQAKRTFDARHILISTMFKDPENPTGREMPVKDFVKAKLEKEREEKILEEIKANNPIEVAENFEIVVPPMPEQPELPPGMMMPPQEPGAEVDAPQKEAPQKPAQKPAPPKK